MSYELGVVEGAGVLGLLSVVEAAGLESDLVVVESDLDSELELDELLSDELLLLEA
jgi:hypothetical protein